MARSMTGYGRAEEPIGSYRIAVEIKSVNHRYFEIASRVPRGYAFLEEKVNSYAKSRIARGKVELSLAISRVGEADTEISVNEAYAEEYIQALRQLAKRYHLKNDISVMQVAANPLVFTTTLKQPDEAEIWAAVRQVEEKAIDRFCEMRTIEGEKLAEDIRARCRSILSKTDFIESQSAETERAYRQRLEQKLRDLLKDSSVDEQRIVTETAIFADKIAVAEETVRLKSHIAQVESLLGTDEPIGRKLDFVVQEMNREANTTGSKAQDLKITEAVVNIKAEIEKIREQIQNLE